MPAPSRSPRSSRPSRARLSVTPSVTGVRRGSHRATIAGTVETRRSETATSAGLTLLSSARGVRLNRAR